MVWNLSCRIVTEPDLRTLATNGLKVEEHIVDGHMNTEKTISLAAQRILKVWRRAQANSRVAHSSLCNILEALSMNLYVCTVLDV